MESTPIQDHNTKKQTRLQRAKPIQFFIIFVAISMIIAFILGGYFIGKDKAEKEQLSKTNLEEQVQIDITELPNNPEKWTEFELGELDLVIKLPETLTDLGDWSENEVVSEKGSFICFTNKENENECSGDSFTISYVSSDFEDDKFDGFQTSKGFMLKDKNLIMINKNNEQIEIKNAKFKSLENENFNIIKILGDSNINGAPGGGTLNAIVTTNNSKYPAIILQMDIEGELQEYEFDQILSSIKKSN